MKYVHKCTRITYVCTHLYMHVYSKIKKKITNDWTSNIKPVFGA